jgi:hypothetical protein
MDGVIQWLDQLGRPPAARIVLIAASNAIILAWAFARTRKAKPRPVRSARELHRRMIVLVSLAFGAMALIMGVSSLLRVAEGHALDLPWLELTVGVIVIVGALLAIIFCVAVALEARATIRHHEGHSERHRH